MKKRKIMITLVIIVTIVISIAVLFPKSDVMQENKVENKKIAMYMLDGPNGNVTGKIDNIQPNYILDENRTVCTGAPGVTGTVTLNNQKLSFSTNGPVSCKVYFYSNNVSISKTGSGTVSVSELSVPSGESASLVVSPASGYYLSSATCTNDFTTNAVTGVPATSEQTVTISNSGSNNTSVCSFTFAEKPTLDSLIAAQSLGQRNNFTQSYSTDGTTANYIAGVYETTATQDSSKVYYYSGNVQNNGTVADPYVIN